jgi:hypothetical protein
MRVQSSDDAPKPGTKCTDGSGSLRRPGTEQEIIDFVGGPFGKAPEKADEDIPEHEECTSDGRDRKNREEIVIIQFHGNGCYA